MQAVDCLLAPADRPTPCQLPKFHRTQEEYLADAEFETVFGMDKAEFRAMPAWKRINAKKSKGLF
jgi:hypothetical protein